MKLTPLNNTDREIRVFISSTFRDMHAERDYLVSHVFPVIRRACRDRQVEFTEIDLRWGVTKEEAEQGKVVRICLEEINRCRPYFLSLLGERYGWSPIAADLEHKAELFALFPFLEKSLKAGLSVTEIEILHGVLDNPEMTEHCFFYLRDKALSHSLAHNLCAPQDYFETDQHLQAKLEDLKHQVRSSGLPVRDNYASIEALAELIKQDLLAVLDTQFPEDKTPTPLEAEQNAHRSYARERCQAYITNPRDTEALDKHLNTATNHALLITGESGLGKSALLAYWLNQQRLLKPEQFIIEHYVGISGDADPVAIIRRIMAEIKHRNHDSEDLPSKPEEIIRDFPLWLAKISERDPLLLIIDGLNQLENKAGLWLPGFWQENVKAIFSVIPGEQLAALSQRDWPVHSLEALDIKRRVKLIGDWLASYRKALATEQTQLIAKAPQTGNPLFLKTVLEELRIFGYFEQLDQRIATLLSANNPQELFILVLTRLENDFGKDIVTQIMQALWAARRGLSETEIAGITGLSRLVISTFLIAIDAHLGKRGGLLSFFHDYLRQAVKLHGLESKETEINAHIKLAQYFEQQELNDRVAEELPWQWQQAEQWGALKDCIGSLFIFAKLYERDKFELLGYWLSLGDLFDPGEHYLNALEQWVQEYDPDDAEMISVLIAVGSFLFRQSAHYASSEKIFRRALMVSTRAWGYDHLDTVEAYTQLGQLLVANGNYNEAAQLLQKALTINEKVFGSDSPDTGCSLNHLAMLLIHQGNYIEAERLIRKSLSILEVTLGQEHPSTLEVLGNLAITLENQEHRIDAAILYQKVLDTKEKIFGADNLSIALSLNNLANLLDDQGNIDVAEPFHRRALAIRKSILGSEHPDTANSYYNIASLLQAKGDFVEAEVFFRKALESREKALGAEHPETADSMNHLAGLLEIQGHFLNAETFYRQALIIYQNILGDEHPSTISCLRNLANILQAQGKDIEAEYLIQKVLALSLKVLEYDHPDTALAQNTQAILLGKQGEYEQAELLFRQALRNFKRARGLNHEYTLRIENNLNILLNDFLFDRELLWKQADFIIAAAYAKSIVELLGQTSLTFPSLLLGAKTANLAGRLEKPIEALSKYESQIQEVENNLGLTTEQIVIPIHDRAMPMDEELKILLQDYRQSTLECLVDALIDRVL